MRLDKFLKVSRIIKRRTLAKEISDAGRVDINGKTAKAGSRLEIGDTVTVRYANKHLSFRVLNLSKSTRKDDTDSLIEIIDEQPQSR